MTGQTTRPRLDQILLAQKWITEAQVSEALMRQRAHGGKFGSQLLYFRHLDEGQLTQALASQLGCEGVPLSGLDIPADVIGRLPAKLACARRVVPFEHLDSERLLKVACEDPSDSNLQNEVSFAARGTKVKLYVAPELSITVALERYYHGRHVGLDDHLQLRLPDVTGAMIAPDREAESTLPSAHGVLLVTREVFAAPLLKTLLDREEFDVHVAEDFESALSVARTARVSHILVHRAVEGDLAAFADRIRRINPGATIRAYESPSALLLRQEHAELAGHLGVKGLELFTSLLAREGANLQARMGRYTDSLCARLGMSTHDRLICTHAAYLHDLARLHYAPEARLDRRTVASLSKRLLASVHYPEPVLEILDAMYAEALPQVDRVSLATLGGRILTLVDLYCQNVGPQERLSLDRFDAVKKKLRELSGRLIPSEIVEAFIAILQEESLDIQVSRRLGQVMVFAVDSQLRNALELRLKNEGFRIVSESQEGSLAELYRRSRPDVLVLAPGGGAADQVAAVERLATLGISLKETPTLLLTDRSSLSELTGLLEAGLEDILASDVSGDFLATKLGRLLERSARRGTAGEADAGARGRLSDMNLIDLLQALGPGRRTVRITVQPAGRESELLTVYLHSGDIRFAQCNTLLGAAAVYYAMAWTDGTWLVESVDEETIPAHNNQLSNESILMEGCRLQDEKLRAGQLA